MKWMLWRELSHVCSKVLIITSCILRHSVIAPSVYLEDSWLYLEDGTEWEVPETSIKTRELPSRNQNAGLSTLPETDSSYLKIDDWKIKSPFGMETMFRCDVNCWFQAVYQDLTLSNKPKLQRHTPLLYQSRPGQNRQLCMNESQRYKTLQRFHLPKKIWEKFGNILSEISGIYFFS